VVPATVIEPAITTLLCSWHAVASGTEYLAGSFHEIGPAPVTVKSMSQWADAFLLMSPASETGK
jgi:hypothetical protein